MNYPKGLSWGEASLRQRKYGFNSLGAEKKFSVFRIIIDQFRNPFVFVLLGVLIISLALHESVDALICGVVIIINALMGFYQEYSAAKTLTALSKILKPVAQVVRDSHPQMIGIENIVPGDIVLLTAGDKIPADGVLIQSSNLLANEAILTGEEEALPKLIGQDSHLYMGSSVLSGKGIMRVVTIGQKTRIGEIGQSLTKIEEEKTPLQRKLERLVKSLTYFILIICALIFLLGLIFAHNPWEIFRVAIVLSIAAIPEGLPIAITVILALGTRRILRRRGLIKKLLAIETLGVTSVICTDKTGTLTEGKMQVSEVEISDKPALLRAIIFANGARSNLEVALLEYAKKQGIDWQELKRETPLSEEPFNSDKKYALSINKSDDGRECAYVIGAPEVVLNFCKAESDDRARIEEKIDTWAREGLKIIGAAVKKKGDLKRKEDFLWVGLIGIHDPLRREAKQTIKEARAAGIKIKIITGDYSLTAESMARSLGFDLKPENILEGKQLDILTEKELIPKVRDVILFTRVSPAHKLKIINALRSTGEVVAMVGDGVNDAPALKRADIGVAVGGATEIAKEASDLILLNSNVSTIVAACEEGRVILANIKKVVGYCLSNSFAEIILIFGSILFGLPAPLSIIQILWIHIICDGPPDIILGFEKKEKNIMSKNPKVLAKEDILSAKMKMLVFIISTTIGLLSLLVFKYFNLNFNLEIARTLVFAIVASASLIYIFSFKNLEKPLWKMENFWNNGYLFGAIIYGFILIFAAIYWRPLGSLLKTVPLSWSHWLIVFGVGLMAMIMVELSKAFNKKA